MRPRTVYLSLGSNLGDRVDYMRRAVEHLRASIDVQQVSNLYVAAPLGYVRDDAFLNAVVRGVTTLAPAALLTEIQHIERELGRRRVPHGPRPIDIDILFYDTAIIETYSLVIPHPRLAERAFVLMPLAEIAPNLVHPVLYYTPVQLLQDAEDVAQVQIYHPPAPHSRSVGATR